MASRRAGCRIGFASSGPPGGGASTKQMRIGLVLPMFEAPQSGEKPRWATIKSIAQRAEDMGFDTVWVADELL